ncbi:MAG: hypothetical protein LBR56_08670, partial [Sporomusaceae bacterium]|nr:hypothetical protein [Sporomusaceae bacterium]
KGVWGKTFLQKSFPPMTVLCYNSKYWTNFVFAGFLNQPPRCMEVCASLAVMANVGEVIKDGIQ